VRLVSLCAAFLLAMPHASQAAPGASRAARPPDIGAALPDFEGTAVDGRAVSLRGEVARRKAVVVLFLSTVCPYANYFAAHMRELSESYGKRGVSFVGVNSNNWESRDEIAEHAKERGFAFPILKDEGHVVADRIGATRTPEAFLVDGSGRLRYRGWLKSKQESPDLQRAIDAVLEGRAVRRPVTKAFGCAVDRY
jgi:peroxiredoxin